MQIRLERRAANGMYLLGSYTYSRALTNGLQQEITGDPGVKYFPLAPFPKADDGFAATDLRHSVTISYLYPLPVGKGRRFLTGAGRVADGVLGGWQINGITTMRSGFPLGFSMSSNQSGTQIGSRPNMTCTGTLSAQDVNKWFDTSCFAAPAAGTLGTAPRTPDLRGPQQENFDASLYKTISVTEHTNLQFRTEFFNVLNHAQFATPNSTVGNPNFGRILSTVKSPRQVQFALKYIF
jgi:hypothetical protein